MHAHRRPPYRTPACLPEGLAQIRQPQQRLSLSLSRYFLRLFIARWRQAGRQAGATYPIQKLTRSNSFQLHLSCIVDTPSRPINPPVVVKTVHIGDGLFMARPCTFPAQRSFLTRANQGIYGLYAAYLHRERHAWTIHPAKHGGRTSILFVFCPCVHGGRTSILFMCMGIHRHI